MLRLFVLEYFRLIDFCKSKDFDKDVFLVLHDRYAKAYQKLDQASQGWIAEQINKEVYQ